MGLCGALSGPERLFGVLERLMGVSTLKNLKANFMTMSLKSILVSISILLACGSFTAAQADGNPNDYLHTRTYLGFVGTSISIDNTGLFSGNRYSVSQIPVYDLALIPSLSSAVGWGILAGHREENYALEVSFWQSSHTATFNAGVAGSNQQTPVTINSSAVGTATYNSINLDFKRYFLTDLPVQPFLDLGVSFPWIDLADADIDGSGNLHTLTLSGLAVNLGLGIEYYLTPEISLVAGAYQRWGSFDQFKGSQIEYNTLNSTGSDEASGLNFAFGATLGVE